MAIDSQDPPPYEAAPGLGYYVPAAKPRKWRGARSDIITFPADLELRKWWARRLVYYLTLILLFGSIAFYAGPNLINFGKLTPLTAADFVPMVDRQCAPIVRAMKEYQRDHGQLPANQDDLVPRYLTAAAREHLRGEIERGRFIYFGEWNHFIEYSFAPGHEQWLIHGPLVNGTIPARVVTIGPSTRPAR